MLRITPRPARLAAGLERAVRDARAGRARNGARVPLAVAAVRWNAPRMLEVAATLRTTPTPAPEGVRLVSELLTDGTSPLYRGGTPRDLDRMLERVSGLLRSSRDLDGARRDLEIRFRTRRRDSNAWM